MTTNSAIQEKVAQESLSIDSLFDQGQFRFDVYYVFINTQYYAIFSLI